MFALGLYDRKNRELLLARDPFGEKPLYYTECNGLFAFASELHALMEVPGFDARISLGAIGNYLTFQHIPAPFTIYDSCRKVAPGHFLRVTPFGVGHQTPYFHFLTTSEPTSRTLDEQADELEEILLRSLRRRLLSDVPLGAFLSGGIDSSTAVALMTQKLNRSIQTFSVGFKDTPESEHVLASQIASHLGTDHTEGMFDPADYVRAVDIAARTDEPNGDSSCIPTNLVSQVARRSVTVAITGDGADELFGGYHRYFDCMMASAKRADDIALGRFHVGADYYSRRVLVFDDNDLRQFFGEIPRSTQDLLLEKRSRIDLDARPLLNRLREADAANYLPEVLAKVDRMSMLHGLEARTPYLSQEVAAFAARLPPERLREGPRGKIVLRQITKRYLPNDWVERPKRGFGIEPFHAAALPPLLERTQRELADGDCALAAFLPPEHLRHFTTAVLPKMNFYHAWSLLFLELWLRSHPHHPQMPLQGS
jgi:asparagine synthase (glutamine-hydrolysing)